MSSASFIRRRRRYAGGGAPDPSLWFLYNGSVDTDGVWQDAATWDADGFYTSLDAVDPYGTWSDTETFTP